MLPNTLAALLKLPAKDRVELAMALWESLTDAEREVELAQVVERDAREVVVLQVVRGVEVPEVPPA